MSKSRRIVLGYQDKRQRMPSKQPFSRKTATRYALVHRPQNDPLINDENAPSQIFTEISGPSKAIPGEGSASLKVQQRKDLEKEFNSSSDPLPINQEVAAEHGIRFNDNYDYLQHLRDIGQGDGESTWVEAKGADKGVGRRKQKLEDALRDVRLDEEHVQRPSDDAFSVLGDLSKDRPSWQLYQEQQDIPDEIAGFQPDMDPVLREVLEALDDEAYVDDDHKLFDELAGERGQELSRDEWEISRFDQNEDEGWESDDTAKAIDDDMNAGHASDMDILRKEGSDKEIEDEDAIPHADQHGDGALFESMIKAKANLTSRECGRPQNSKNPPSIAPSAALTTATSLAGRTKRRKGALTSSTRFSMTSSALARTETMSTLDSRFDQVLDSYMDDIAEDDEALDDSASAVTGMSQMTGASNMSSAIGTEADDQAPSLISNAAFTSAMDEYLTNASGRQGRKMKKGGRQGAWGQQRGMDQLDEIRKTLGPARFSGAQKDVKI